MEKYDTLIDEDRKKGTYCILFSNREALDEDEIEEKFSEFGNVYNIKFHADNKRGICFIRYEQMDEAVKAVEGLRGDPHITLLEHNKKKQKDGSSFERRQGNDNGRQNYDGIKFTQQFRRQTNQDNGRSGYNRNEDYKENSSNGMGHPILPWATTDANGNQKQNDVPWGPKSSNEYKKQNDVPYAQKSPKGYQKQNGTFQAPHSSHRYQENNDGLPDLIDRNRRPMAGIQNQSTEVPELVTADGRTLQTSNPIKKRIILAQEVIVANIHPRFGGPYILHLFDQYEPLAISNIMVEPKTGKRYCHVYFKSAEESQQVETHFDKQLLIDQRLVVIQSNRLVESAYFK